MAIIKTRFDDGDVVYTIFDDLLDYVKKIHKVKIKSIKCINSKIYYLLDYPSVDHRNDCLEHQIIGKTKKEVRKYIDDYFDKEIKDLNLKRQKLLDSIEK